MRYRNTSDATRIWPGLTDNATGCTLQLDPGETAEVDGDVTDTYLTVVKEPKPAKDPAKPATSDDVKD